MLGIFGGSNTKPYFRTRSKERDRQSDAVSVGLISQAIEQALAAARAESEGLRRRLDDITARAAVTNGNGDDEYLTREGADVHLLDMLDEQMRAAEARLDQIEANVRHFQFLQDELLRRFAATRP